MLSKVEYDDLRQILEQLGLVRIDLRDYHNAVFGKIRTNQDVAVVVITPFIAANIKRSVKCSAKIRCLFMDTKNWDVLFKFKSVKCTFDWRGVLIRRVHLLQQIQEESCFCLHDDRDIIPRRVKKTLKAYWKCREKQCMGTKQLGLEMQERISIELPGRSRVLPK